MNFDPRRAAGNRVLLFSCGGRADGGGAVTDSQLFPFADGAGAAPLSLTPKNAPGTCFTVKGDVIDEGACANGDANQTFVIGEVGNTGAAAPPASGAAAGADASDVVINAPAPAAAAPAPAPPGSGSAGTETFDCSG